MYWTLPKVLIWTTRFSWQFIVCYVFGFITSVVAFESTSHDLKTEKQPWQCFFKYQCIRQICSRRVTKTAYLYPPKEPYDTLFPLLTGDILEVNCSVQGDQTLSVSWSREYAEFTSHRVSVRADGTLIITQLVPEDSGKYFCTAESVGGAVKINTEMNLVVVKSESLWYDY